MKQRNENIIKNNQTNKTNKTHKTDKTHEINATIKKINQIKMNLSQKP